MALNDIILNPSLLKNLYHTSIIATENNNVIPEKEIEIKPEAHTPAPKKKAQEDFKYLGEFKKKILLVVHYDQAPFLPDESLEFLQTILTACKLNLADVAILNTAGRSLPLYNEVKAQLPGKVTVLFGTTPEQFGMPVNFPEFQVQPFNDCTYLYSPVLEKLASDELLKRKLWVSLKKIFSL